MCQTFLLRERESGGELGQLATWHLVDARSFGDVAWSHPSRVVTWRPHLLLVALVRAVVVEGSW